MLKIYISWSDALFQGEQEENDGHKVLLRLINQVWQGLVSHQSLPDIEGVVFDLQEFARAHFVEEEAQMARNRYPHLQAHQASHARFIADVEGFCNKVAAGETVGLDLLTFINDWLRFHVGMADRQYSQFLRSRERLLVAA